MDSFWDCRGCSTGGVIDEADDDTASICDDCGGQGCSIFWPSLQSVLLLSRSEEITRVSIDAGAGNDGTLSAPCGLTELLLFEECSSVE